jgi:serine/threonine-protein kinase
MEKIDKYLILEKLGSGGMGVVYKARDPVIGREVAIKVISEEFLAFPEMKERFYREARAAGNLSHENLTIVYDVGEVDGKPYIVMEFLKGKDLRDIINEKAPLPLISKLDYAKQICKGLASVHAGDVIHRDIKPENIRILDDGKIKIMDFGIAKPLASNLTRPGTLIGTPAYMSPEQIQEKPVVKGADIFSFGILFYELLAYQKPFDGDENTVMYKIVHEKPSPLRLEESQFANDLQAVIAKCLKKKAEDRYADFSEILVQLERIIAKPPKKKRRLDRVAVFLAFLSILVWGIWMQFRNQSPSGEPEKIIKNPVVEIREGATQAHSAVVMELAAISNPDTLLAKLSAYRQLNRLAFGNKDDFESPGGLYVFVADAQKILGVYKLENNIYTAVKASEKLTDLSTRFKGKTAIWVQELKVQSSNEPSSP